MENEPDIPVEDAVESEGAGLDPRSAVEERAARISSLVFLGLVLLVSVHTILVIFGAAGPTSVEKFSHIFREIKLGDLPVLTRIVTSTAFMWFLPVLAAAAVAKEFVVRNRMATLIANGALLCLAVMIRYLYLAGVFAPLVELMNRIGEG